MGGMTLTSCARQADAHAVGVAQQRDQQAPDDQRVGHRLVVFRQVRGVLDGPVTSV